MILNILQKQISGIRKILSSLCLILLSFFSGGHTLNAQSPVNPIDKIMEESEGQIHIEISPAILEIILQNTSANKTGPEKSGINKMAGYRIQVFSDGRNQNTLESRAKARGNAILAKFPKYKGQVYTFSSSPNWYTRIGNFRNISEANSALAELKKAFPAFASEMRVVKSQIIVIKQ